MTVATRAGLYVALMLVFGMPLFRARLEAVDDRLDGRFRALVAIAIVMGLLLSVLAFLAMVAAMTGSTSLVVDAPVVRTLLAQMAVGRAAIAREVALALALVAVLVLRRWAWPIATLGAFALATLAWSGHGVMDDGWRGAIHLPADIAHLLAAGAWIGALVSLLLLAIRASGKPTTEARLLGDASVAFASTGTLIVGTIVVTGIVNYVFIAGPTVQDVVRSTWGLVLIAKLGVFTLMLMLAAANRYRLAPRLAASRDGETTLAAVAHLRRSLWLEMGLGLTALLLVGWLGTLAPDA